MASKKELLARGAEINSILAKEYPDAKCPLVHKNPYELLIATILSAQCTDERVNMVTPPLFRKLGTPKALAGAAPDDILSYIKSVSYPNNKTRHLKEMATALVERFGGKVPSTMEELTTLPGVGRKTANVVLGNSFDTPGLTVDTHFKRVTGRLGLTKNTDPEKVERDLMQIIPQPEWTHFSHRMIWHGRRICQARKPLCEECVVRHLCAYYAKLQKETGRNKGTKRGSRA